MEHATNFTSVSCLMMVDTNSSILLLFYVILNGIRSNFSKYLHFLVSTKKMEICICDLMYRFQIPLNISTLHKAKCMKRDLLKKTLFEKGRDL